MSGFSCIELSERGAAAYGGKVLYRLGADLVKVEGPDGDPLRSRFSRVHEVDGQTTTPAFDYFNAGKTTKRVAETEELHDLVSRSDVFLLDLEPSRYPAWGLGADSLESLGCSVVCAITPFGLTGPYRDFRSSEFVQSAFGGMSVGIGDPNREPLKMPFMQTAIQGGLIAAIASMGVLFRQPRGKTTVVEISESDVWATIHAGTTMVAFLFSNRLRRREGRRVVGLPYPHQLFNCKDGWIGVQASERHQYDQFIEMVGSPEWAAKRRFGSRMEMNFKHADAIDTLLAPWFLARTRAEIFAECRARKIPAAPVHRVSEVQANSELRSDGAFETYEGATGSAVTVPAPPFRFGKAEIRPAGAVPRRP